MNINQMVDVVRQFIQREFEVRVAYYEEPDQDAYQRLLAELERFYALETGVYMDVEQRRTMDADWLEEREEARSLLAPRLLFQVRKYPPQQGDEVFRAYLSSETHDTQQNLCRRFDTWVVSEAGPRIVSIGRPCLSCLGRGLIGEEPCSECAGKGWEHGSGKRLGDLGPPVEVLRFLEPETPSRALEDMSQ